jgi:hypothetical protein
MLTADCVFCVEIVRHIPEKLGREIAQLEITNLQKKRMTSTSINRV